MKWQDVFLCSLFVFLLVNVTNSTPVQFPEDDALSSRALQPESEIEADDVNFEDEARFHHHKQKLKKKKKKKLACLLALHHNRQKRQSGDPRTLWWGAVNYYDTDVFYYGSNPGLHPSGGYPYQQGSGNPCEHVGLGGSSNGLGSQIINVVGGLPGLGSSPGSNSLPGAVRPPILPTLTPITRPTLIPVRPVVTRPPAPVYTTTTTSKPSLGGGDGGGDNSDEDYDYSEGYPSTNTYSRPLTNRPPRRRPTRPSTSSRPRPRPGPVIATIDSFGDLISSVPAAAGTVLSSFGSGVRPVFQRSERVIDDYVVKPFNDSVKQLVRWLR